MTIDNLSVPPMAPPIVLALSSNFGSAAGWRASFMALADAQANESGWVELAFAADKGVLQNR